MTSYNYHISLIIPQLVDQKIISWLGDLAVTYIDIQTCLDGSVSDQSELFGLINRVRDLGLRVETLHLQRISLPDK